MTIAATTQLEAINIMLSTIGEASTTILTGTLPFEVSAADLTLDEVIKSVQQESFTYNTNHSELVAASSSLDTDILNIYGAADGKVYTIQGTTLWSMDTNAAATGSIIASVVRALDFTLMPEVARHYIIVRAARLYADRLVGSKVIKEFTERDELEARKQLDRDYGIKSVDGREATDLKYDTELATLQDEKDRLDSTLPAAKLAAEIKEQATRLTSLEAEGLKADAAKLRHALGSTELEAKTLTADKKEQALRESTIDADQVRRDSAELDSQQLVTDIKDLEAKKKELLRQIARRDSTGLDTDKLAADIKEIESVLKEHTRAVLRRDSTLDADVLSAEISEVGIKIKRLASDLADDRLDTELFEAQTMKMTAELMNMDMDAKLAEDYEARGSGVNPSMLRDGADTSYIVNRRVGGRTPWL